MLLDELSNHFYVYCIYGELLDVFIVIIILLKFRNLFSHSPQTQTFPRSSDDVFSLFFSVVVAASLSLPRLT